MQNQTGISRLTGKKSISLQDHRLADSNDLTAFNMIQTYQYGVFKIPVLG